MVSKRTSVAPLNVDGGFDLVGRSAEVATLQETFTRIQKNGANSEAVVLIGESGSGKVSHRGVGVKAQVTQTSTN